MATPAGEDTSKQLNESLRAVLDDVASSERFTDFLLEVSSGSQKGDNYLGLMLRVRIVGTRDGKSGESMSLIVKCMPKRPDNFPMIDFYNNEASMYKKVLPTFARLQKERGLPDEMRFDGTAKWYACDWTEGSNALVFEDMSTKGYRLGDRLGGLDYAHCSLGFKQIARLHALSFAMKDQRPEEFQKLQSRVKETVFRPVIPAENGEEHHFEKMVKFVTSNLLKVFPADSKYVKRFQEFGIDFIEHMVNLVKGEEAEPYAVICHGDCWTNNYLFKYSKDDKTPVAVCLVDLQLSRYSSPITDLSYFLYCNTKGDVRREMYKTLLSDYYNSFSQFLRELGSDPETLFPYSAFQEHERKFSQFGLAMAVVVLHLITTESKDTPDLEGPHDKDAENDYIQKRSSDENYISRIHDVVVDMVDNNFI